MDQVKIRHPEIGEATVAASAVPHWQSRGWRPVDKQSEGKQQPGRSGGKES